MNGSDGGGSKDAIEARLEEPRDEPAPVPEQEPAPKIEEAAPPVEEEKKRDASPPAQPKKQKMLGDDDDADGPSLGAPPGAAKAAPG